MNTQPDDFENNLESGDEPQPDLDALMGLMRLLVGGAMEGVDELFRRLKEHQIELKQNQAAAITIYPDDETDLERLRYALIGLLFETPQVMARSLSTVGQTTTKATNLITRMISPVTNSRLMRPVQNRYDTVAARGEEMLERLVESGWSEEKAGRLLARNASAEVMDELLAYLAEKPEIRQLVQQQGVGLAGELVEQIRGRAAAADNLVDRISGTILRRPQPELSSTEIGSEE
jgi:hypothetical protein